MAYKFKDMEKIAGIFIVIVLLAVLSLLILIMRGKNFFVQKNTYYTYYSSGENLTKGMAINYNGMKIGQITTIKLNPDNRVLVRFYVLKEYYDRVKTDSVANFVPGLLGGGKLNLTRGTISSMVLPDGSYINSSDSAKGKELLRYQQASTAEGLNGLINNANELLKQLHNPQGNLNMTLEKLQLLMVTLNEVSKNMGKITGSVDKEQVKTIMLNLRQTSDNLVEITKNLKHVRLIGGSPEKQDKNSIPATK
jgi:phospholipid/cholesterol/gamma-HCH transport system substrate-binding protein